MFMSGEKWVFLLCPKTYNFDNYCPWCSVTSKLYMGSAADKSAAYNYKRKEKFVGNVFVVEDPRDADREKEERMAGTVKIYEFPAKVEMKLKEEITDMKNGLGPAIFDPSDEGYDFILKVLSTKKDDRGRQWPDYSNSAFARRPSGIADTDGKIRSILDETKELDNYIKTLERDNDFIKESLKNEMVYDLIETEWKKHTDIQERIADASTAVEGIDDDIDDTIWDKKEGDDPADDTDDDLSDEKLLEELNDL